MIIYKMLNKNFIKMMFNENWLSIGLADINKKKTSTLSLKRIIETSFLAGIRNFDVAPNYYEGMAEIELGKYLKENDINKINIFSKVGQLSNKEINERNKKKITIDNTYWNFSPDFVEKSILKSLDNLKRDSIACIFIHNPEDAISNTISIYDILMPLIPILEKCCEKKIIKCWGISSWQGLGSLSEDSKPLFNIFEIHKFINKIYKNNHFQVLQVPLGTWNYDHFIKKNHEDKFLETGFSLYEACNKLKLFLMLNSPFLGGDHFSHYPSIKGQNFTDQQLSLLYFKNMFPNTIRVVGLRSKKTIDEASLIL